MGRKGASTETAREVIRLLEWRPKGYKVLARRWQKTKLKRRKSKVSQKKTEKLSSKRRIKRRKVLTRPSWAQKDGKPRIDQVRPSVATVLETTRAVLEPTAIVLESTGAVLQPTSAYS